MIEQVDHLGIVVQNLDQAVKLYRDAFGIEPAMIYESVQTRAKIAFFQIGQVKIELLQPVQKDSVLGKFLEKKGEGFHHLAYRVKDVDQSLRELQEKGIQVVDQKSRQVRDNERVGFLHPRSTQNVLIELIQEN